MADKQTGRLARAQSLAAFSAMLRALANDATNLRGELDRNETDLPEAHERLHGMLDRALQAAGPIVVQRLRADVLAMSRTELEAELLGEQGEPAGPSRGIAP